MNPYSASSELAASPTAVAAGFARGNSYMTLSEPVRGDALPAVET